MDREYQKAIRHYSVSHMNNAKWRKLLTAWAESGVDIEVSHWRFIDSEHEEIHSLPKTKDLLEKRFSDSRFQPFEYKWILSIYIPRAYKPVPKVGFESEQNIDQLKSIAQALGHFPVFDVKNGLEVRGYEK